jgi:hypothetical protein
MRKSRRILLQSTVLVALTAGILAPSVQAGSLVTTFGGHVTGTQTGTFPANVATNDVISTSSVFQYSPTGFAPNPVGGKYVFTSTSTSQSFGVTVNYPTPNTFPSPSWTANYVPGATASFFIQMSRLNTTTIQMEIFASTNAGTDGTKSGAFVEMFLTSTKYTTTTLPTTQATLNEFLLTTGTLVWDPLGPAGNTPGFTGLIDNFNGNSVPEPSSFLLLSVATAACGIGSVISRRKLARA